MESKVIYSRDLEDVYVTFLDRLNKYKKLGIYIPVCVPKIKLATNVSRIQNSFFSIVNVVDKKVYTFEKEKLVKEYLSKEECIYILLPFIITDGEEKTHVKLSFIDKKLKNIYVFDPYGVKNIYPEILRIYYKKIKKIFGLGEYRFIDEHLSNPEFSFQYYDELEKKSFDSELKGYCAVWMIWFIDFFSNNLSEKFPDIIYDGIYHISKSSPNFRKFIKKYHISLVREYLYITSRRIAQK